MKPTRLNTKKINKSKGRQKGTGEKKGNRLKRKDRKRCYQLKIAP
jgi:ribosomal protein L19E